ncbi:MAG: DUF47 domain-containing protein [Planctomycetota bacterium]
MSILDRLFSRSPFSALVKHTHKVHECVELVRPLVDALLEEDYERIEELHKQLDRTEHEADIIKTEIRDMLSKRMLMAVNREDLVRFLRYQDDVADAAEDFSVVLSLRRTKVHPAVKEDLRAFSDQVIRVSEKLLNLAHELVVLAEQGFAGKEARIVLEESLKLGEEEWKADKLQRKFAMACYALEEELDPVTLIFYDKICHTLSMIANNAESTGKFLHMLISHR